MTANCIINEFNYQIKFTRSASKQGLHYRGKINFDPEFSFWLSKLKNGTITFTPSDYEEETQKAIISAIDALESNKEA